MSISCRLVLAVFCLLVLERSAFGQVNTEKLRTTEDFSGWAHNLAFDLDYASGNSAYSRLGARIRTDYAKPGFQMWGVLEYKRGIQNNQIYINRGFAHVRFIKSLSDVVYGEVFGQREFNDFLRLKNRNLLGGGIRLTALADSIAANSTYSFHLGVGGMWENEILDLDPEEETSLFKSTNYVSINARLSDRVVVSAVSYIQFAPSDFDDHRILFESGFTFNISRKLAYRTALSLRYDNQPPGDLEKVDIGLTNSINVFF